MNKEIKLLIQICKTNKKEFSAEELAAFLNLKYVQGVYSYIRRLQNNNLLYKKSKGSYYLNDSSEKVKIIRFLISVLGSDAEVLFTIHAKNVLEKFSINPILKSGDLPHYSLTVIKDIAKKTRIIYSVPQGKEHVYFIRSWDEPTKKLLAFFNIALKFDEEEYKHTIIKSFSESVPFQKHVPDEKSAQLAELNIKKYLESADLIIDKLKNLESYDIKIVDIITDKKKKDLAKNPFEITHKIADWKIKYIYNTDRIEGNALTMDEVRTILTVGSEFIKKEKKDVLETTNSRTALENIFDTNNELAAEFVKKLHMATQQGIDSDAGEFKKEENCIVTSSGELIDTTTPAKFVEERMDMLIKWYGENKNHIHPFVLASVVHNQFVFIHPFNDGNGRVARLLFNFVLIKNGYFPVIFYNDQKQAYYSALRQTHNGDMKPFVLLCADLYRTQIEYF